MLALGPENTTVLADGDSGTYYVVVETSAVTTADGIAITNDTELTVNFTVFNRNGAGFLSEGADGSRDKVTLVKYEIVEPDVTVVEPHNVSKRTKRTVGGDTTFVPGTELTLRLQDTDGTNSNFLKAAEPVVGSNRTWRTTFDFSDQRVGDTYEIVVKHDRLDGAVTEAGAVVAPVDTTTTSETVTIAPTASATSTDPVADTPTSMPGFGVVVALVALLVVGVLPSRLAE